VSAFPGFPSRLEYVPIPKLFYSDLLPHVTDVAELLVTLHLFRLLAAKRGYPQAVARHALAEDPLLAAGFTALGRDPSAEAERGLTAVLERGAFVQAQPPSGAPVLLLNSDAGRRAATAIARGETPAPATPQGSAHPVAAPAVAPGDIYTLYEENIGVLTPIIADQLAEAEREYPPGWVAEAVGIAVAANQRHWRYVHAILERWRTEGKDDGKPARHSGAARRSAADYTTWLPARPPQR
jgi:DnaD/phage-associated family protein